MSGNVVDIRPAENPDVVLEAAKGCDAVVVLSYRDGDLVLAASLNLGENDVIATLSRATFMIHAMEAGE